MAKNISFGVRFTLNATLVSALEKFCEPVELIKSLWTSDNNLPHWVAMCIKCGKPYEALCRHHDEE